MCACAVASSLIGDVWSVSAGSCALSSVLEAGLSNESDEQQ